MDSRLVCDSYLCNSAEDNGLPVASVPPVIRTWPSLSRVAVCPTRGLWSEPASIEPSEAGAYSSDEANTVYSGGVDSRISINSSNNQYLPVRQQGNGVACPHCA